MRGWQEAKNLVNKKHEKFFRRARENRPEESSS
jgi:hypothetical protein